MNKNENLKQAVAEAAMPLIKNLNFIGVGTGSTVNYFIDALAQVKNQFEAAVASSVATEKRLKSQGIPVVELNQVTQLEIYVDGADEFNHHFYLIKGGGGALTREKIIATSAKQFICIADETKQVKVLGRFPVAVEVIPMARSFVAREIVKLHGDPVYRQGFVTDNGNVILDVFGLDITDPPKMETLLNNIPGVVGNGIFAQRKADKIFIGTSHGVERLP